MALNLEPFTKSICLNHWFEQVLFVVGVQGRVNRRSDCPPIAEIRG
jgi:hypothetical protein